MTAAKLRTARTDGTGQSTSTTFGRAPGQDRRPAKGISDGEFDRLLSEWLEDSGAQDVSVTIKLECSGFTLRVSDRVVVATMLKAELQRRREMREAMS